MASVSALPVQADIHVDGFRALVEPIQVRFEKRYLAVVQPQTLPDTVAKHEAAVKHRNLGIRARHQFAAYVDENVFHCEDHRGTRGCPLS